MIDDIQALMLCLAEEAQSLEHRDALSAIIDACVMCFVERSFPENHDTGL